MFRKPIYRYLLAGLLIIVLIGAGSAMAYRAGFAQGTGFEGMPFTGGEDGSFEFMDSYGRMDGFSDFGHMSMPYGRTGHFNSFGFSPFFSIFGMLFQLFLIVLVFKFIFRLLFFSFGMRRRRMMHGMHEHGRHGMHGCCHEHWDDEGNKAESTGDESKDTEE